MHLAAAPLRYGVSRQRVIVFMIAADEYQREGQAFQPVQRFTVATVAKPHTPEVAIIPNSGQRRLYRKKYYPEIFYIALKMQ